MKNVLIDFSHYDDFNGFGEIARNYIHTLVTRNINDLHFIFILPRKHRGRFGAGYDYIDREDKRSQLKRLDKHIDLWHATDQQFHLRGGDSHTIQLLTVHDCNFMTEKKGVHKWRHILQLKWRVRRSDHLTTISHFVLDDLNQNGFIMGKPVDVIYNGIANDEDMPQQQPSFITDDKVPFFFSVGQIREKKNLHTLVPMMKYFPHHLLFICGDNHFSYANQLQQLISEQGEGRVMLTGKISNEEKRWLYSHCAAFLFPSRLEGFGIPVLEAMRYHCKVFSSRMTSLPEVCGEHASYWDDFTPEEMAKVVREGLQSWQKDGREAQLAAGHSQQFNYERYTDQYLSLYRKLLG